MSIVYQHYRSPNPYRWPAYFENWIYLLLTLYFTVGFLVTGSELMTLQKIEQDPSYGLADSDMTLNKVSSIGMADQDIVIGSNDNNKNQHGKYVSYSGFARRNHRKQLKRSHQQLQMPSINGGCKVMWVLRNIIPSCTVASIVLYWFFIHDYSKEFQVDLSGYVVLDFHGINLLLILIDLSISRIPVRLLHFFHPLIFSIVYIVFNYAFETLTGENVYASIDWQLAPLPSIGIAAMVVCLVLLAYVALFLLHCCTNYVESKTKIGFFIVLISLIFLLFLTLTFFI